MKRIEVCRDYDLKTGKHTSQNKMEEIRKRMMQLKKLKMAEHELDELLLVFTEF